MKIFRFGWSVPAAAIITLAATTAAQAQDVRNDAPAAHTVKSGDTLWDLAKTYLGDAYLWPSIYRINTDQIEDPHWIYPGEVLRLPGGTVVAEQPRGNPGLTVFAPPRIDSRAGQFTAEAPKAHVAIGDVIRAAYVGPDKGPAGPGRILFGADIPGIDMKRTTTNFQMYDKLLMEPPVGSVAAERERFIAYTLGESIEDFGQVVIPTALLQVTRAPRNGEAAIVEVLELYGQLNAETPVTVLDTLGAGAIGRPMAYRDSRTTKVRAIHRNAVLPSLNYEVLFDLAAKDGMKVGDEVQVYRPREDAIQDERLALPEVPIATGQVIRVTRWGSTARITSQAQPAIRVGESVRLIGRMP
ncbi:MAG: LysM peptidoglycan-binding domain-containing protein [Gemmatimonadaceae bacterium]